MKPAKKTVVVIGAGISGLATARQLLERKYTVTVLEARERIGGRIHTERGFDFGAHWIHGTEGNPLTNLARDFGLPVHFMGGDSTYTGSWERAELRDAQGRKLRPQNKIRSILQGDELRDTLDGWRNSARRDLSIYDAVRKITKGRKITPHALWHLYSWVRDDCAADLDELSALNHDVGHEVFGYGDSVIRGGFAQLVKRLSKDPRLNIENGQVVKRIEYSLPGGPVRVFTKGGRYAVVPLEANAVVVTVPLGVLKAGDIEFSPDLPDRKKQAIAALGFGCLAKLGYQLPKRSLRWFGRQYVFARMGADQERAAMHPNVVINGWASHEKPLLILLVGGSAGRAIEKMPEAEAKRWGWERIVETFRREIEKHQIREPTMRNFFRTTWTCDEFARGAYSFIKVGASGKDIEELAEPLGTCVYFAGEATSRRHWGYAHGAYLSGLHAAARVIGDKSFTPDRYYTENRHFREIRMRAQRAFDLRSTRPTNARQKALITILERALVFNGIQASDRSLLAGLFGPKRELKRGDFLCRKGSRADKMFIVCRGRLQAVESSRSGNVKILNEFKEADIAGDYAFFREDLEGKRTADLVAAEDNTVVYPLKYRLFDRFLLAFPSVMMALHRHTTTHLLSSLQQARPSPGGRDFLTISTMVKPTAKLPP